MSGPWEKYQTSTQSGPWTKYGGSLVDQIPGASDAPVAPTAPPESPGIGDRLLGAIEAPASVITGLIAVPVGAAKGVVKGLTSGKYGTPEGVREGAEEARQFAEAATYTPRSQTGRELVQGVGRALSESGIMGVPLPELNALASTVKPTVTALKPAAQLASYKATTAGQNALSRFRPASPEMAGGGAAVTRDNLQRAARAESLPVPMRLTKGQAERGFEQQRFERETAKLPEGEPLRQRFAEQNEQVLQNFDAFKDASGAELNELRQVGQAVNSALQGKMDLARSKVRAAYNSAREAGEMEEPVSVSALRAYLEENSSAAKNAPVLQVVESELKRQTGGAGTLTINQLEELRKTTGHFSTPGTPNAVYGPQIKTLIDQITEGKGGELYKYARRMNSEYAGEFKNQGVIAKLLRNKPGTTDRMVAFEDVFSHSILNGSLDDVRAMRHSLQNAGEAGQQAWKELQGQTIQHIKDAITQNVARDINGNPIVSPAKLDAAVRSLDADNKLNYIFGKQGAQQIRDINELAKDIYTSPPGAVNYSNTATVLSGLLDTALSGLSGMPLPILSARRFVKSKQLSKQVGRAVEYNASNPPR